MRTEFGLRGRQRVIVRHSDKEHDHVHVFWCTISVETGRPPAKQWFLKKGVAPEGQGIAAIQASALSDVPAIQRQLGSYDKFALTRAQNVCRLLEKKLNLRQLRSIGTIVEVRAAGELRPSRVRQTLREDRTGCEPLMLRADAIRAALTASDWPAAHFDLAVLGLCLEPVYRATKAKGQEVRGLMIYDLKDIGNRMPASTLDTPDMKFGLRQLEKRHSAGASTIEQWWPTRSDLSFVPSRAPAVGDTKLREKYAAARLAHASEEQHRGEERRRLRALHLDRRRQLSARLNRVRKWLARRFVSAERRAFYKRFSASVRAPRVAGLDAQYANQDIYKRRRFPSWREFASALADAPQPVTLQIIGKSENAVAPTLMPPPSRVTPAKDTAIASSTHIRHEHDRTEEVDDTRPVDASPVDVLVYQRLMNSKRRGR